MEIGAGNIPKDYLEFQPDAGIFEWYVMDKKDLDKFCCPNFDARWLFGYFDIDRSK